jgi:hypothetical protein
MMSSGAGITPAPTATAASALLTARSGARAKRVLIADKVWQLVAFLRHRALLWAGIGEPSYNHCDAE